MPAAVFRTIVVALLAACCGCSQAPVSPPEAAGEGRASDAETPDLEALRSLGYVGAYPVKPEHAGKVGVVRHDERRAFAGLNLYNTDPAPRAHLVDMQGGIVHTWAPRNETWPWHFVEMLEGGDLLAISYQKFLMRLDWESNVVWARPIPAHHDVSVYEGKIHVLSREFERLKHDGAEITVLSDKIAVLSSDGEILENVSLWPLLKDFIAPERMDELVRATVRGGAEPVNDSIFDVFHANTVEVLDKTYGPLLQRGNVLVAARALDLIAVVDIENEELVWSWGRGELEEPHMPTALENGNILIFDNGTRREYSRILELDPTTGNIVWEYRAHAPESFFTERGGSSQPLPNGNVLITESRNGRAFEVTRDGEIVWEYFNPDLFADGKRAWFYRLTRLEEGHFPPDFLPR